MSMLRLPGPQAVLAVGLILFCAAGLRLSRPPLNPTTPAPAMNFATDPAGADQGWWQTVSQDLQRAEYEASHNEHGLQAPNRAQNLRTYFNPQGIEVLPRTAVEVEAGAWRFAWETVGFGRPGAMRDVAPSYPKPNGARVEYAHDGFSEWYENTPRGLEQCFTIDRRPPGDGPLAVAGTISGGLVGKLVDGAVDLFDEHGARVLRYGKLEVRDANGHLVPSRLALVERTLAIEVEDRNASYPITIDPLLTSPAWAVEGDQVDAQFGWSVATAGDVNGDGFSDVIVGARFYDNGQFLEGRAFVYCGSSAGLASTAWTAESNREFAQFGHSVATAGDVNADGFSDVIVAASYYDNGQTDQGRAYVYHGSATGLGPTAAWTAEGDQENAVFGFSVATAGDVNGDGYSDVVVGAWGYSNGQAFEGRALVYHGSAAGLATAAAGTVESNQAGAGFGASVGAAGDVNGDGFSDVIVGSP